MSAYYNEINPYAAQWLRNLIAAGHIASGEVDERSICDVAPADLAGFTQCHFFAGIGVWSHALRLAGWPDDQPVWTGSCPCQPFSAAGKRNGFDDERHLWPYLFRLISKCRPPIVFGEQVASLDGLQWLDAVQADLEGANYASAAVDLCAAGVGAPHIRQRLYWVADAASSRRERIGDQSAHGEFVPRCPQTLGEFWSNCKWVECDDGTTRPVEPSTFPLAYGATARVGRLRAYGNAIVPQVAQAFIRACMP